ncbi:MAG: DNA-binding response regulator [Chloroflexi bacterium B3_Chlor]|nr:MAG: DNA-binding response regulator [Chloroflexi bacterium B3_Chlor]
MLCTRRRRPRGFTNAWPPTWWRSQEWPRPSSCVVGYERALPPSQILHTDIVGDRLVGDKVGSETILVVDDEPRLVRLVREILSAVGYEVLSARDGEEALETLAIEQPDLVLLDILLPGDMDGYDICGRVREFSSVPIIMLNSKTREVDMLHGFDVGADDYLTKPFSAKELIARVKAVLRRSKLTGEDAMTTADFACGELVISFARHKVKVRGREVSLTPTEFKLLQQLSLNTNRVMLHDHLLTKVWGPEYRDDIDYLRTYIRHLRQKIEESPSEPRYILTTPGVGSVLSCIYDAEYPAWSVSQR